MSILEKIKLPEGLKELSASELDEVVRDVREKIIDVVSNNGGHLSSSLGTVELSIALHTVLSSPQDKIIWDVGHQSYAHKILTGRLKEFDTLRQYGGISGFPNKFESPHDIFTIGHAGTSVSTALGLARARDILSKHYYVVAVIGDAALGCGMALEALNNVLGMKKNFIVILNDNEMSISRNVGAWSRYFTKIRTNPVYTAMKERGERIVKRIPKLGSPLFESAEKLKNRFKHFIIDFKAEVIFEELGFKYLGPIDGHNVPMLISTIQYAKDIKGPVLIHIYTQKGHGYKPAEKDPTKFHGITPFNRYSGEKLSVSNGNSYTAVFGRTIAKIAESEKRIVAITAAMVDGTGLDEFAVKYPNRFFDVGIAEEHAVSFAAGLSVAGLKPVVAIYSTFLQRAYDQIVHDICLQNLRILFCLDRSGIAGEDGPTHNGVFDIAYLRHLPNMVVASPKDENELQHMIFMGVKHNGPFAIRYPRATGYGVEMCESLSEIPVGKGEILYKSQIPRVPDGQAKPKPQQVLIIAIGSMVYPAVEAAKLLEKEKISATVINARFIKPLDKELIVLEAKKAKLIVTVEEGNIMGGFGSAVLELFSTENIDSTVKCIGLPDEFIEHGGRKSLLEKYGLTEKGIADKICSLISK